MATTPRIITRTINGSRILAGLQQGKEYTHVPFTTLNEALGSNAAVMPLDGDTPRVRYYAIGINGHVNRVGTDGGHYTQARQKGPEEFGLYNQIPFVLRSPTEDLTQAERAPYALRKIIEINGEKFIAYYLKRIPISNEAVKMLHNTVVDGVTTTVPYVPTNANLHPVPKDPSSVNVISTNGTYLSTSAMMTLEFSAKDVEELLEVAKIMFGSEERALISEIALVAGSDRTLQVTDPGQAPFAMNEVVQAQISTNITGLWPVAFTSEGFTYDLDLGGTEPMVGMDPSAVIP
ncbi:virion structural protein [Xanthomonas phage RTH11]|nr:virion structural protein [Xanthomonas phage RTH11]